MLISEADLFKINQDFNNSVNKITEKSTDANALEVVNSNVFENQFLSFVESLINYCDADLRQREEFEKFKGARIADVQKEIDDIREELDKLPDGEYKSSQLFILTVRERALKRL